MVADGPRAWCGDRPAAARSRAAWSGSRGPGRGRCGLTALCPVPQGMSARLQKLKWSEREWETRRLCGCVCACTQLSHTHSRVLARHVNTRWRRARTLTHTLAHPPGSGPGGPAPLPSGCHLPPSARTRDPAVLPPPHLTCPGLGKQPCCQHGRLRMATGPLAVRALGSPLALLPQGPLPVSEGWGVSLTRMCMGSGLLSHPVCERCSRWLPPQASPSVFCYVS